MAGEIASTLLSRMTVPVLYYMSERRREPAAAGRPTPTPAWEEEADAAHR